MAKLESPRCPSAPAQAGALVLGAVVGKSIAYFHPAPVASAEALRRAGPGVEQRFRFSLPCIGSGCENFAAGKCALIGRIIEDRAARAPQAVTTPHLEALPSCSIRTSCQWFRSAGANACEVCPTAHYAANSQTPSS